MPRCELTVCCIWSHQHQSEGAGRQTPSSCWHCTSSEPGWGLASVLEAQSVTCMSLHLDHKAFSCQLPLGTELGGWIIISGFYIFFLAYGKICLSLLRVAGNENVASRACSLWLECHGVWLWLLVLVRGFFLRFWSSFFFPQWGSVRLNWSNFPCPQQFLDCAKNMLTFLIQAQTSR